MAQETSVCPGCGLRKVTRELKRQGVTVRFCDECYWGQVRQPKRAEPDAGPVPAPSSRERGTSK
jgi:hypothetical protein